MTSTHRPLFILPHYFALLLFGLIVGQMIAYARAGDGWSVVFGVTVFLLAVAADVYANRRLSGKNVDLAFYMWGYSLATFAIAVQIGFLLAEKLPTESTIDFVGVAFLLGSVATAIFGLCTIQLLEGLRTPAHASTT